MPRTDRASRVIAAPPEHVYAALVNPEALTAWLPPTGMTGTFERFDPRPGGSYRLVLTYADASASPGKTTADTDIVESRFIDLVPGVRVVQAVDFVSDDPTYAGTMTMTWEVTEVDGGTRVDIIADNVPDGIAANDHAAGLASSLMNLAGLEASDQNLRAVLTVAQQALLEMVGLGEELVSLASLRDAALGLAF
ncbi:MAG: SRPBCC family protein [Solirubrobacteraceae bacterium]